MAVRWLWNLGLDVLGIALATAVVAGAVGLTCHAAGWPLLNQTGYIDLRDGNRVVFSDAAEKDRLTAEHRGNIAGSRSRSTWTYSFWMILMSPYLGAGTYLAFRCRTRLREWFEFDRRAALLGVAVALGCLAFQWAFAAAAARLGVSLPNLGQGLVRFADDPLVIVALAVLAIAVAPIVEEVWFRGHLYEARSSLPRSRSRSSTSRFFRPSPSRTS